MEKIYTFDTPLLFHDVKYAYGEEQNGAKFEGCETCPVCGGCVSSLKWQPPRKVKLSKPKFGDLCFGTLTPFIVSERFKDLYQQSGLTGIKEFYKIDDVKVSYRSALKSPSPTYYHIEFQRIGLAIDYKRSKVSGQKSKERNCDLCNPAKMLKEDVNGIFFKEGTYNPKYDIFWIYEFGDIVFFNERFKDFCIKNEITNFEDTYILCEDYISPMPDERLKALYKKYGIKDD